VGTPLLSTPLQREEEKQRPDYLVHSYTKDLCGHGNVTAGVVIGRNEDMFMPKGQPDDGTGWESTLFWNVYYIKGAFLDSEKAFDVLSGIKTLDLRMKQKCINTRILATFLDSHPDIRVNCNALESNPNHSLAKQVLRHGLSAPLFTIDMDQAGLNREVFQRFIACLAPLFSHQVSVGQTNTMVLCPALTSQSELSEQDQRDAGIFPTTVRISVGLEDPKQLISHFLSAARLIIDSDRPGFSDGFMSPTDVDRLAEEVYTDCHRTFVQSSPALESLL